MKTTIGKKEEFAIEYDFFKAEGTTEISLFVNGENILAFYYQGEIKTTRWNLDDIAEWLRRFIDNVKDDPFPVEIEGDCAAEKDVNAREFDSDNDDEFDQYYDKLDEWNEQHRWHQCANGGIIADLYFQQVNGEIEISWNNLDDEVEFVKKIGFAKVVKDLFLSVINQFLINYADYWFG